MGSVLYRPARANVIWLVTGGVTVTVAVLTVLRLALPSCVAAAGAGPGSAAAVDASAGPQPPAGNGQAPAPAGPAGRPGLPGTVYPGRALFYDPGRASGSCMLGPFPPGGWYASLSPRQFDRGHTCGTYLEVHGPSGTVRAEVVDLCPTCPGHTVNLSRAAYRRIGDLRPGVEPVSYQWVANPRLPGPLAFRVTVPAPGELAVQVLHHGNRLASVALAHPSAAPAWHTLRLIPGDFWLARGTRPGLFTVLVADVLGHEVLLPRVMLAPGRLTRTRVWMYRPSVPASPAAQARPSRVPARPAACPH
jgi:expansin (peptidoglycan-binding protein)